MYPQTVTVYTRNSAQPVVLQTSNCPRASAVEVSTSRFERSHGKAPRGFGCWIFETDSGEYQLSVTPASTYAQARRTAVAFAKSHGVDTLHTAP